MIIEFACRKSNIRLPLTPGFHLQLAAMKRKLQQKEQMLIEKEKQLTELKAEKWEKDKEQRQRISAIQKESMERLKLLQVNDIVYKCLS